MNPCQHGYKNRALCDMCELLDKIEADFRRAAVPRLAVTNRRGAGKIYVYRGTPLRDPNGRSDA